MGSYFRLGEKQDLISIVIRAQRAGDIAQVVEHYLVRVKSCIQTPGVPYTKSKNQHSTQEEHGGALPQSPRKRNSLLCSAHCHPIRPMSSVGGLLLHPVFLFLFLQMCWYPLIVP
jgi:hypothetical protein